jgi:hypothetical protein
MISYAFITATTNVSKKNSALLPCNALTYLHVTQKKQVEVPVFFLHFFLQIIKMNVELYNLIQSTQVVTSINMGLFYV